MVPVTFAQSTVFQYPLGILLFLVSLFLILLILVQRGRGGGLTGALGGMGGQSAFGSKAGDLFTRITVVVASVWIVLCLLIIVLYTDTGFGPSRGRRDAADRSGSKVGRPPADRTDADMDATTGGSAEPTTGGTLNSNGAANDADAGGDRPGDQ